MQVLVRRLQPLAPAQDFSPLLDCVVQRWMPERDQPVLAGRGLEDRLYVLEEGFAFDFSILPAGRRHIFDFYGPGAICNWARPERDDRPENIMFKARSEVQVLDRVRLNQVLAAHEGIAQAIHKHEVRRAMRVSQRVRALIALPAKEDLRMLLLDLDDEYRAAGEERSWVPIPLTQDEIGDLIGSTSVHVSRTLAALERDGEIERRPAAFRFHGIEEARQRMSYRRFFDPLPDLR